MSYMNQAAFAHAGGIQELSFDEVSMIGGGEGFFEKLGKALDSPGETIGRAIDQGLKNLREVAESGEGTGYWANGVYNIK